MMTTSITCSNFPKYVFCPNSAELSADAQKKAKLYAIFLACSVIGYPICGIIYLVKLCCDKGSKTNQVAQHVLNPQNSNATNIEIRVAPSEIERFFRPFIENISRGWDVFAQQVGLDNLESISIITSLRQSDLPRQDLYFPHGQPPNKDALLPALTNYITNFYTRHAGSHTPEESWVSLPEEQVSETHNYDLKIEVVMNGREVNGIHQIIRTLFFKNGLTTGLSGCDPQIETINRNQPNYNIRF
jgi:hypothetical protein